MSTSSECFCGCSFKKASQIVGVLAMLSGTCWIIFGSIISANEVYQCIDDIYGDPHCSYYNWYAISSIMQGILACTAASILFKGLRTNQPGYLMSFIILMALNIVGYCIGGIILISSYYYTYEITYAVIMIISAILCILYIYVVYTYRLQLIANVRARVATVDHGGPTPFVTTNAVFTTYPPPGVYPAQGAVYMNTQTTTVGGASYPAQPYYPSAYPPPHPPYSVAPQQQQYGGAQPSYNPGFANT